MNKVRQAHETGCGESVGYRYQWKQSEAEKIVLRTHTTSISAAMLYELANQKDGFKPAKMFSIDRVFRNEAVDATHLAEFHQVEGVVADYGITLGDLIGFMEIFFSKMGIKQLRFKPAYNPYTEVGLTFVLPLFWLHVKMLTALIGNLLIPPWAQEMGRNWQLWHFQA